MICPFCLKDAPAGFPQCPHCQAPVDRSVTPPYSGIFRRIMALFFDVLIPSVLFAGLYIPLMIFLGQDQPLLVMAVPGAILLIFTLLQLILLFSSGQTIGKKLMGIKIIRVDYEKAGFGALFMREIVGRLVCSLTLNIGYLIALFNPERRGLHDKIGGTIVVKKLRDVPIPAAAPEPVEAAAFQPTATPPPLPEPPTPPVPIPVSTPPPAPPPAIPLAPVMKESPPPPPVPEAVPASAGVCPACQSPIEDSDSKFCLVCGFPIQSGVKAYTRFCPNCKAPVAEDAASCPACGRSMPQEASPVLPVSNAAVAAEATVVVAAPQLISYTADGAQEVFNLSLPLTKIGRLKDNHIALTNEKAVSSHHCEIYMEGQQFFIRDLGSTNGVYINNRKVENSPLADGDKIKLGFKIFRFKQG
jgi:uncharacterized RDD family membrane protein YckC